MSEQTKNYLRIFFAIGIMVLFVLHFQAIASNTFVIKMINDYSYLGVGTAAFLSGLAGLPVPVITFAPLFVELGLALSLVIITVAIGLTLGDLLTYGIGRCGRSIKMLRTNTYVTRVANYIERYPRRAQIILFLWAAFAPLPNELILIPLGIIGTRFIHILLPLFAGNLIFNLLAGYGITNIFALFT